MLQVETAEDRRLVARAARELNRQIVHTLNEAGVAAVGLEASGRGLIRRTEGSFFTSNVSWLRDLVAQGVVPVVAALMPGENGATEEVSGGTIAGTLALALSEAGMPSVAAFLTKNGQDGLYSGDRRLEETEVDAVSPGVIPEPEALRGAVEAGAAVVVSSRSGLRANPVRGTTISKGAAKKTP